MRRIHGLLAFLGGSLLVAGCGGGAESTAQQGGVGGPGAGGANASGAGGLDGAGQGGASTSNGGASASGGASGGTSGEGGSVGQGGGTASGGVGGSGTGGNGVGGSSAGAGGAGGVGVGVGGSGGAPGCFEGEMVPCYSGDPGTAGVGSCAAGAMTCTGGVLGPCLGEVLPTAEACNLADDDCNGTVDELGTETCGLGACEVTVDSCQNGVSVACVPLAASPTETCEGTDDDCDGQVDEGCLCIDGSVQPCYGGPAGTEGVGLCAGGTQTCVSGGWGACAGAITPVNETCDGQDQDCDGQTDESLGTSTCGVGACQAVADNCVGGVPQQCQQGAPSNETCNGIDDDCDGTPDDGLPTVGCGNGQCAVTVPSCVNGQPNACVPGAPSSESCNGSDDDCDNVVDDGDPGGGFACSTGSLGQCAAGTTHCSGGAIVCTPNASPSAEVCNNLDDDCDGAYDEGDPGSGVACSTGNAGVCSAGTTICTGGTIACAQNVQASPESCNGLDDDCDGAVDDGNPGGGSTCSTGLPGACGSGVLACSGGALTCVQTVFPAAEVCNGVDDDCDGTDDEGNPGGGASCNTGQPGVCAQGSVKCTGGALSCSQTVFPVQEICANNLDDNCNGTVDESVDQDGDGWGTCTGDCCDAVGGCSGTPALVNPGAYEVLNNNVNDDCDASTGDAVVPPACGGPALQTPSTALKLVHAMDLCNFTTQNPPLPQKKWGVITQQLLAADGTSAPPLDIQGGVLSNYGPNVTPRKNSTMAAISSGTARDQGDPGWVQPNGGWMLGGNGNPPPVYLAAHNGQLQTKPGCPTGTSVHDSSNLRIKIRVPTNAKSFSYKFKFYSAEYPEWVCTQYNDFFLALLTSTVAGIPADRNISFDTNGNPVSINNAFFDVCSGCSAGTNELVGTGMGGNNGALDNGGGTVWLTTTSPITPGEDMVLELITWDTGDHAYDSLVLLDDFKWALTPATVGTIVDN